MHRTRWFLVLLCLTLVSPVLAADPEPAADEGKVLYAIGLSLARSLAQFDLNANQLKDLQAGLSDGVLGKEPKVNVDEYQDEIRAFAQARMSAAAEQEKEASRGFLEKAATEKGAVKTDSGLIFIEVKPGTGDAPKATDTVKVHYHGTLRDGTVFDSSVERGTPATFALNRVIPCWTEGVQRMKVGGKAKLVCPSNIAYGDRGAPPKIKPGAALVFEVELIEIEKPAEGGAKGALPPGHP